MEENENLLLIDKPKGITSFDVIRQLRRKLNIKKMGHAGTLDPNATGLLLIGVEEGTKKIKDLIGLSKVYEAEILLGKKTDSGDITGKVIEEKLVPKIEEEEIKKALESMIGDIVLEVSLFSAMKRKGKPLYKYAQKGVEVTKPKRVMTVIRADFRGYLKPRRKENKKLLFGQNPGILAKKSKNFVNVYKYISSIFKFFLSKFRNSVSKRDFRQPLKSWLPDSHQISVEFEVGSGTYIRSLAEELGERLGTVATLQNLRRTRVGNFSVEDARLVESL